MSTLRASVCIALVIMAVSSTRAADVRQAVQHAVPATVSVEWQSAKSKKDQAKKPSKPLQAESRYFQLAFGVDGTALGLPQPDQVALTSGTIVSADGLIASYFPGKNSGKFTVTLADDRKLPGKLAVEDKRSGLILLKVDAAKLPHIKSSPAAAEVGQAVIATFCTSAKDRVVTQDIVSATNRAASGLPSGLIQTDVRVGPMSAGGPLVDDQGKLLGIIVAKEGRRDTLGLSFALPPKFVRALLDAATGKEQVIIERGYLGIRVNTEKEKKAVFAIDVLKDSPADKAGIKKGDEIVAIKDQVISNHGDVVRFIQQEKADTTVTIKIRRDNKNEEIELTLGSLPTGLAQSGDKGHGAVIELVTPAHVAIVNAEGQLQKLQAGLGANAEAAKRLEAIRKAQEYLKQFQNAKDAAKWRDAMITHGYLPTTPTIRVQ